MKDALIILGAAGAAVVVLLGLFAMGDFAETRARVTERADVDPNTADAMARRSLRTRRIFLVVLPGLVVVGLNLAAVFVHG